MGKCNTVVIKHELHHASLLGFDSDRYATL